MTDSAPTDAIADATPDHSAGRTAPVQLTADLISFIRDEVAIEPGDIEPDTDLLIGGFVDSLGVVVIVGWLESRLDIRIDPADVVLENFLTVADMVRYVGER